jgi:hypothetical protein
MSAALPWGALTPPICCMTFWWSSGLIPETVRDCFSNPDHHYYCLSSSPFRGTAAWAINDPIRSSTNHCRTGNSRWPWLVPDGMMIKLVPVAIDIMVLPLWGRWSKVGCHNCTYFFIIYIGPFVDRGTAGWAQAGREATSAAGWGQWPRHGARYWP